MELFNSCFILLYYIGIEITMESSAPSAFIISTFLDIVATVLHDLEFKLLYFSIYAVSVPMYSSAFGYYNDLYIAWMLL